MTLKEVIDKLNTIPKHYGINQEEEVIVDAWIAGQNDREYPPGTLLFECRSCNLKPLMTPEDSHILSICPKNIGMVN